MEELTKNYFYNKKVFVYQGKKGYRFSIDSPVLAAFLPDLPEKNALEIGCGSGIISLLSIYKNKYKKIYCYEIQKRLSDIASLNVKENSFEKRIEIINADFLEENNEAVKKNKNKFDIVFSNPPFFQLNKSRLSTNEEKAIAKFELKITLERLLKKTRSIMNENGDLYLILPYDRFIELQTLSEQSGYSIVKKRNILLVKGGKPERFLIQLRNNRTSSDHYIDEEPLIIYTQNSIYTEEMNSVFGII